LLQRHDAVITPMQEQDRGLDLTGQTGR
jgi:hypothetical protein